MLCEFINTTLFPAQQTLVLTLLGPHHSGFRPEKKPADQWEACQESKWPHCPAKIKEENWRELAGRHFGQNSKWADCSSQVEEVQQ